MSTKPLGKKRISRSKERWSTYVENDSENNKGWKPEIEDRG